MLCVCICIYSHVYIICMRRNSQPMYYFYIHLFHYVYVFCTYRWLLAAWMKSRCITLTFVAAVPSVVPVHSPCAPLGGVHRYLWESGHCLTGVNDATQQCGVSFSHQCSHRQHPGLWEKIRQRGSRLLPFPLNSWERWGIRVWGEPATCSQVTCGPFSEPPPPQRMQWPISVRQSITKMCCYCRRRESTAPRRATRTTTAQEDCEVSNTQSAQRIHFTL